MARVKVKDGICGHTTVITTKKLDKDHVEVKIVSPCDMVKNMGEELGKVEWKRVFAKNLQASLVYSVAGRHIKHAGCAVPVAIIRALEVELEMAPAKNITIEIEK